MILAYPVISLYGSRILIVKIKIQSLFLISSAISAMHRVGSSGNTSNSIRTRKEKRLTYVLNDADDTKVSSL